MKEELQEVRVNKIIKLVKENRNLPINDIKRIIRQEIPDINGEELFSVLIKYSDSINNREEKGERE